MVKIQNYILVLLLFCYSIITYRRGTLLYFLEVTVCIGNVILDEVRRVAVVRQCFVIVH